MFAQDLLAALAETMRQRRRRVVREREGAHFVETVHIEHGKRFDGLHSQLENNLFRLQAVNAAQQKNANAKMVAQ